MKLPWSTTGGRFASFFWQEKTKNKKTANQYFISGKGNHDTVSV